MTGAILAAVEIQREATALARARETLPETLARRRAERIAAKMFARARIAALVAQPSPSA